jgi:putative colanic acid biosynthesis acetyltransferase WcaF
VQFTELTHDSAYEMPVMPPVQNLSLHRLPPGFRGRPAWLVQLWWIIHALLFQTSPQIFYGWRRFLLRLFGAEIGKDVMIRPSVRVTFPWKVKIGDRSWIGDDTVLYSLGPIVIGKDAVVSQGSYLCTGSHDYSKVSFDIYVQPIVIEDEAWVATRAFISPGVTVGHGALVGACSLVLKDVPPMTVCAGNPSHVIRPRISHDSHWQVSSAFAQADLNYEL